MFAGDSKSIQKVNSISESARLLAGAENVPGEIAHCLQLIQLISRDAKYLIELRDENYQALQNTPRELHRINEIIICVTQSLADVDLLLEKYRNQAHGNRNQQRLSINWLLNDSKTFSLRSRNLQTQHQTVLYEINHIKMQGMIDPMVQSMSKFENLDLLKSLLGDKRKPDARMSPSFPAADQTAKTANMPTEVPLQNIPPYPKGAQSYQTSRENYNAPAPQQSPNSSSNNSPLGHNSGHNSGRQNDAYVRHSLAPPSSGATVTDEKDISQSDAEARPPLITYGTLGQHGRHSSSFSTVSGHSKPDTVERDLSHHRSPQYTPSPLPSISPPLFGSSNSTPHTSSIPALGQGSPDTAIAKPLGLGIQAEVSRPHSMAPTTEPNFGLMSLFQKPVSLKSFSANSSSTSISGPTSFPQEHKRGSAPPFLHPAFPSSSSATFPYGPTPPSHIQKHKSLAVFPAPGLSAMPSTTSMNSQWSDMSNNVNVAELDGDYPDSSQQQHQRPRPVSATTAPACIPASDSENGRMDRTRYRGLSQLFVYQPRSLSNTSHGEETESATTSDKTPFFELEGTTPVYYSQPVQTQTQVPAAIEEAKDGTIYGRTTETPDIRTTPTSEHASVISPTPDLGSRRDEVDSAAWHRKTKIFATAGQEKGRKPNGA